MEKILLNDELRLICPDGFHVVSDAEMSKWNTILRKPDWCISDPDKHIIISLSWRKFNPVIALLAGTKDAVKSMESKIREANAPYDYHLESFTEKSLGGKKADGMTYIYTAENTGMTGTSLIVRNGRTFYYIHAYYRQSLKAESIGILDQFLSSFEWV